MASPRAASSSAGSVAWSTQQSGSTERTPAWATDRNQTSPLFMTRRTDWPPARSTRCSNSTGRGSSVSSQCRCRRPTAWGTPRIIAGPRSGRNPPNGLGNCGVPGGVCAFGYIRRHVGEEVTVTVFTREDRQRYRDKVKRCLDVFARMLAESAFDKEPRSVGLEIELNLTEATGDPAMANAHVLELVSDPDFQTELGQFNVEINIAPRMLAEGTFRELEEAVRASLNHAEDQARKAHAHMVIIGILPTLTERDLDADSLSGNPRYRLLNEQIFAARGEDLEISITGVERLQTYADTIAPEAACTSVQLHQQVGPDAFAAHGNAAQAIAGVQLAVGANSPFFFGRELWRETRIALFEQATDTRPEELKAQGVRPRVWFGERWITSIFDLFEENVRFFPALLPVCDDEDPVEAIARGDVPHLSELRLHNGTIYRWNRPIYDTVRGRPQVRVENRVLPAGPTVVDSVANAAFYYGLIRMLADEDRPIWSQMSFSAAADHFHAAPRAGIDASL